MASFDINSVMQSRMNAVGDLYRQRVNQIASPGGMFSQILSERINARESESMQIPYIKATPAGMELVRNVETKAPAAASTEKSSADMLARRAQYQSYVNAASQKYGVSAALINGVIQAESSFRPDVTSSAGAQGLMQLMPGTAKELGVTNSFDPAQNIDGGVQYLRKMIDRFDGDLRLALAAYNCGPGRVESLGVSSSDDSAYMNLSTNVRGYVDRVIRYATA